MVYQTYTSDVYVVGGGSGGTAVAIPAARHITFSKIQRWLRLP
jgi:hypothetical protein